ncbi:SspB family protein [Oceanibaculum indicum]|uniref:SspB family protein n=1 Tax=Oceanibaculum indicum TaxID=526216 RepID=UPI000315C835|nr:ClpXP protease specificity-enhancing factor SspB [Oceanibaculum indicum]
MQDQLRYDRLVEEALRSVVRTALTEAAINGLPGDHHFYITFKTQLAGVDIPAFLRQKYEDEMTIVLQHQFWGLKVTEDRFEVLLSFNDVHEKLSIPFTAITGFVDPSVKFGLQFQVAEEAQAQETPEGVAAFTPAEKPAAAPEAAAEEPAEANAASENGANVVTLDKFRKK